MPGSHSGRRLRSRVLAVALATLVALAASLASPGAWGPAGASPDDPAAPTTLAAPAAPPAASSSTVVENVFLPAERDLSECISAVPKPGCGSEAHGGWRQGLILAVLVAGLAFIAWRVIRSARRNRPGPPGPSVQNGAGASG